jgi:hypothetical protein
VKARVEESTRQGLEKSMGSPVNARLGACDVGGVTAVALGGNSINGTIKAVSAGCLKNTVERGRRQQEDCFLLRQIRMSQG